MLSIESILKSAKLAESVGIKPYNFGQEPLSKMAYTIPSEISNSLKKAKQSLTQKTKPASDTFRLVEKVNPETGEKYFTIE